MSYPPARYRGESGEVSARIRPADQEPELIYQSGGSAGYLATGASTNGQFGLYRWNMAAAPGGPAPHFHRSFSESFYVLSGTVRLYDGARWIDGTPGDFLYVPEGGVHAFRNESGEPASMLLMFAPGAPREAYFEGLTELARLTDEERAAFMVEHDTYWV
ncbi:cupin domain-containing protein [Micromonospora zhanjiangensis]|uniref:Cupin domain-containing protein n=1 Tax=Micromonospora zhanjiangensis TaxID=1522057 RepID=A0ABV8KI26_9ACTN